MQAKFIRLHEAGNHDKVALINLYNVTQISEGYFQREACCWVRYTAGRAQAVMEDIETINILINDLTFPPTIDDDIPF